MIMGGVVELNVHQMNQFQAKTLIDANLRKANNSVYRIRVIHGYHNGTALRNMIRKEYKKHPKVIKIEIGTNQGITDLVLKNLY